MVDHHDDELFEKLEDRLESLGLLEDADGLRGAAELGMVRTLETRDRPLADPEGFELAHRTFVRAIEAITAHGRREPTLSKRERVIRPVLRPLVQLVAAWIVDRQTNRAAADVRRLYELREANAAWNTEEHRMLRRARLQMCMITDELRGSRLTLPVFLLSGAFLSATLGLLQSAVEPALRSKALAVLLGLLVAVVLIGIAATVLRAASIARMRLRLALTIPLDGLYKAIGSTGPAPKDRCFQVAVIALIFFAIATVVIPAAIVLLMRG